MTQDELLDRVKAALTKYLDEKGHRKTSERYAVLEHIYSTNGHFDVESLLKSMTAENKTKISRATLYNTLDLFVEARLVFKHQFGTATAQYERSFGIEGHHHLVCNTCGEVRDLKDKLVRGVMTGKKLPKFEWDYYTLYIFGTCNKCLNYKKKMLRQTDKFI